MSYQRSAESVADTDVAAALSKRLGLPIKWIEARSEAFLATVHGRDLIAYVVSHPAAPDPRMDETSILCRP